MSIKALYLIASSIILTGCSIHPLPRDVANNQIDTVEIVKNLRCEAKHQVKQEIRAILRRSPSSNVRKILATEVLEPRNLKIMNQAFNNKPTFRNKNGVIQTHNNIANVVLALSTSAISYNFKFEITESDDSSAGISFRDPFSNGIFNLFGGGSLSKTRVGKREFQMVENFSDLVRLNCDVDEVRGVPFNVLLADHQEYKSLKKNIIYPLIGSVGMDDIMSTYLGLVELGGGKQDFSDSITFSTSVDANIGADVTVIPGTSKRFRLAQAIAAAKAARLDVHQVIISIAFPDYGTFLQREKRKPTTRLSSIDALNGLRAVARREATYVQCRQREEAREDGFRDLRDSSPARECFEIAEGTLELARRRGGRSN